jgi:hypothetical protein
MVLRGRGGDVISRAAGSGVLGDGALAAKPEMSEDAGQGRAGPEGIANPGTQHGQ